MNKKLLDTLEAIRKTQGKDIVINLVEKPQEYPLLCHTGSLGLDEALGGGWAKGRIIEISGQESSGKTTAAIHAMINIQKQGKIPAFIDVEQAFDHLYFQALGGDMSSDKLIFIQPDNAEQAFDSMEMLAESGEVALIVLDSTNALSTKAELEGASGDLKVGLLARLLGQHLRKVNPYVKNGVTLMYISQMREKIGVIYGDPRVIGVGNAMKFFAAQRVMFSKMETLKDGDISIANKTKARVFKNKVAPPFKECEFSIVFGKGISQDSEIISACLSKGILIKDGSGVKLGFKSPIWGESALESTEGKTEIILKTPEFTDIYYEICERLNLSLGKHTQDEFDIMLKPIYDKYKEQNEQFALIVEEVKRTSGKSLYVECLYHSLCGLQIRPFDKEIQKKVKQMEEKLEGQARKGTNINWKITITNDIATGPHDIDVKPIYDEYLNNKNQ